ncbi:MAG: hypothetical protein N3A54_01410 [Patescibacteria group bacterium]|nr:hypothetical protein [Patescibacteria group bacterium]
MIVFKKIKYKNFLSSGNQWTEIDLNTHKTTLLFGKNGSGKSTVTDAITFSLYGKSFRKINKPQLVNNYNKGESVCIIEFSIWNKNYRIVRGQKPTIFEIYENEKLINQSGDFTEYQKYLEENILKMNYKTFTQMVVVGSATYVPFMQLNPQERRVVVEDILNIDVIGKMNASIKPHLSDYHSSLQNTEKTYLLTLERVKLHEEYMKTNIEGIDVMIASLVKEEEQTNSILGNLKEKMTNQEKIIDDMEKKIQSYRKYVALNSEIREALMGVKHKLNSLKKSYESFNNESVCQKCNQPIPEDYKAKVLAEKGVAIAEAEETLKKLQDTQMQLTPKLERLEEIKKNYQDSLLEMNSIKKEWEMYQKSLQKLKEKISGLEKKKEEILKNIEKNVADDVGILRSLEEKKKQLKEEGEMLEYIQTLLKDGGIKSRIIAYYLPTINALINKYLSYMNFKIGFYLNENFEERITNSAKESFSYENFSEGEKLRIDLAILFAWRDLIKNKNKVGHVNLLIMDEILDSSLDADGISDFIKIIKQIIDDKDNNVFLISHKDEQIVDKFHRAIRFEKPDGRFTRIRILPEEVNNAVLRI